ncbi:hypothetical protein [Methanobrevibacter filiformis]|uniref:PsbP C-terminal domain-containing protein n=1 Tax=Methanobrevibacter filiformis TaxID=55758 RepID=A0A166AVS6_9EURY|nr:hypothetical protein [Methanobrevibacter filiformis]KZX12529.1 hypothetical protein MBFIL_11330 [Methanobrevibacter filiformis]
MSKNDSLNNKALDENNEISSDLSDSETLDSTYSQDENVNSNNGSNNKLLIAISGIVLIVVVVAVAWFAFSDVSNSLQTNSTTAEATTLHFNKNNITFDYLNTWIQANDSQGTFLLLENPDNAALFNLEYDNNENYSLDDLVQAYKFQLESDNFKIVNISDTKVGGIDAKLINASNDNAGATEYVYLVVKNDNLYLFTFYTYSNISNIQNDIDMITRTFKVN